MHDVPAADAIAVDFLLARPAAEPVRGFHQNEIEPCFGQLCGESQS
jgi:hypothetical protein